MKWKLPYCTEKMTVQIQSFCEGLFGSPFIRTHHQVKLLNTLEILLELVYLFLEVLQTVKTGIRDGDARF